MLKSWFEKLVGEAGKILQQLVTKRLRNRTLSVKTAPLTAKTFTLAAPSQPQLRGENKLIMYVPPTSPRLPLFD
jgi:hypothetical protein